MIHYCLNWHFGAILKHLYNSSSQPSEILRSSRAGIKGFVCNARNAANGVFVFEKLVVGKFFPNYQ